MDDHAPTVSPTTLLLLLDNDDNDDDAAVSTLSDAQDMTLAVLPIVSGALSAWGSANIIYMVCTTPAKNRNPYKRILLGLSVGDFCSSLALSLQAFLLPHDTSQRVWASGTDATCTAMGFFQQLSLTNIWYNGMLSFFFLLTIRYGLSNDVVRRTYEPWMHGWAIGFPLVSAILGVALGMYGELRVGHFCWFTGDVSATYMAYEVEGLPNFFFFCAIPINNLLVYCHVRQSTVRKSRLLATHKNDPQAKAEAAISGMCPMRHDQSAVSHTLRQSSLGSSQVSNELNNNNDATVAAFSHEQQQPQRHCEREDHREQQLAEQRQQLQHDRQKERRQAVAFQAFLYVASYVVSYLPTNVLRVTASALSMDTSHEAQLFPLLVLQAILWPLQGFFNYLIYSRPSYLRESISAGPEL